MGLLSRLFNKGSQNVTVNQPAGFYIIRYEYGEQKAWNLFESASRGNVNAQLTIADSFLNQGENVLALPWYEKAANAGSIEAFRQLVGFYEGKYEDVEPDLEKAQYARKMAWPEDDPETFLRLANQSFDEEKYQQAFEYYKKAADYGNDEAIAQIGLCYLNGNGVEQNDEKAFEWLSKSCDRNYGYYNLAQCYLKGIGTNKNMEKAVEYLEKAVEGKCGNLYMARKQLLNLYRQGYGGAHIKEKKQKLEHDLAYEDELLSGISIISDSED